MLRAARLSLETQVSRTHFSRAEEAISSASVREDRSERRLRGLCGETAYMLPARSRPRTSSSSDSASSSLSLPLAPTVGIARARCAERTVLAKKGLGHRRQEPRHPTHVQLQVGRDAKVRRQFMGFLKAHGQFRHGL